MSIRPAFGVGERQHSGECSSAISTLVLAASSAQFVAGLADALVSGSDGSRSANKQLLVRLIPVGAN
jgi:hypothetical protein